MSEAITRTLPFLRRYARAVTGSQERGDEWVRLCAEVAMQQPELIAHHFARAGMVEPAIDQMLRAGRRAIERSANAEAIGQLRPALERATLGS